jgi:hypothetical protein
MSDASRGPLFPPREGPSLIDAPLPPVAPAKAPEQPAYNLIMASQIERAVTDVFLKRFGQMTMPYGQARDLTYLERDLISALVTVLAKRPDAP